MRGLDAYRRLTTAHDDDVYEWDARYRHTVDFRTNQQHSDFPGMIAFDRKMRTRPVVNSEFGYERGVGEKLPTYRKEDDREEQLRRAWWIYLARLNKAGGVWEGSRVVAGAQRNVKPGGCYNRP